MRGWLLLAQHHTELRLEGWPECTAHHWATGCFSLAARLLRGACHRAGQGPDPLARNDNIGRHCEERAARRSNLRHAGGRKRRRLLRKSALLKDEGGVTSSRPSPPVPGS